MRKIVLLFNVFMVIIGCTKKELVITEIPFEFGINNAEPNLVSKNGILSLSWINYIKGDEATLFYTQFKNQKWTEPIKVASGKDWFVNWADFPANAANGDLLLTNYLKKSANGTYTYDIILNLQKLNGEVVKKDFLLNTDGVKAEHGFVSIIPNTKDGFLVTWLDGRNTTNDVKEDHHKAMTIRAAKVTNKGDIINETEIDGRTCDCCQTSITMTNNGPIIVYRDRSRNEIRDIYYSIRTNNTWSEPKAVYNDNWKINGCPVNGPKIASNKVNTAVSWFTVEKDEPKVKVSFLSNKNDFNQPIILNDTYAIGRVDVAFINENEVLVSYMETDNNNTYLRCKKVNKNGTVSKAITISKISAQRNTGVPQLEILDNYAYLIWTTTVEKKNQLKLKKFNLDGI